MLLGGEGRSGTAVTEEHLQRTGDGHRGLQNTLAWLFAVVG